MLTWLNSTWDSSFCCKWRCKKWSRGKSLSFEREKWIIALSVEVDANPGVCVYSASVCARSKLRLLAYAVTVFIGICINLSVVYRVLCGCFLSKCTTALSLCHAWWLTSREYSNNNNQSEVLIFYCVFFLSLPSRLLFVLFWIWIQISQHRKIIIEIVLCTANQEISQLES